MSRRGAASIRSRNSGPALVSSRKSKSASLSWEGRAFSRSSSFSFSRLLRQSMASTAASASLLLSGRVNFRYSGGWLPPNTSDPVVPVGFFGICTVAGRLTVGRYRGTCPMMTNFGFSRQPSALSCSRSTPSSASCRARLSRRSGRGWMRSTPLGRRIQRLSRSPVPAALVDSPGTAPYSRFTPRQTHTRRKPGPQSHGSSSPPRRLLSLTPRRTHDRRAAWKPATCTRSPPPPGTVHAWPMRLEVPCTCSP
jgi:hypothetical protein